MKTVLTAFSDALIAGRSEILTPQIHTEKTQMKEIEAHLVKIGVNLCSSVALYHFANAYYYRGTQRYGSLAGSTIAARASAGAVDFAVGGCPGHRGCYQRRMVSGAERFWRTHPGADRGGIAPSRRRSIDRPSYAQSVSWSGRAKRAHFQLSGPHSYARLHQRNRARYQLRRFLSSSALSDRARCSQR